ncbi:MAG: hypothetical protein HY922_11515 [Elusimicrobia bacterium]|nr:hypothetical protein [Elusimicrobiota bacterium]
MGQPSRESPLFWYQRDRLSKEVGITLPAGYELYYAPEAVRLEGPGSVYRAAYAPAEGALAFSEEWVRNLTEIAAQEYPKHKRYREEMARFTEKWIVLKKK